MRKTCVYLRVSTSIQTTDNQLVALQNFAQQMNLEINHIYKDEGVSGTKDKRQGLDEMLKDAVKGKFNQILIYDISRLGRSLKHLINILNDLNKANVRLIFIQNGIDTSNSTGQMMFQLLGVFAEWERNTIVDRVNCGLERARLQGKKLGRPTSINESVVNAVKLLRNKNLGIRKIATELKLGCGTVSKIIRQSLDSTIVKTL
jgi:DNA invertase Pin-like site-specific DNA recombinase